MLLAITSLVDQNMASNEDEAKIVVEEKDAVTVPPSAPRRAAPNTGFSWVPFCIISAIVAILGIVIVWLPSSLSQSPTLIVVHRQNKLWGVHSDNPVVPEGGDVCQRVPGCACHS